MVFQDPYASLHPQHRIERAFIEPLKIHHITYDKTTITSALEQVGSEGDIAYRYPHQLSGWTTSTCGYSQSITVANHSCYC